MEIKEKTKLIKKICGDDIHIPTVHYYFVESYLRFLKERHLLSEIRWIYEDWKKIRVGRLKDLFDHSNYANMFIEGFPMCKYGINLHDDVNFYFRMDMDWFYYIYQYKRNLKITK